MPAAFFRARLDWEWSARFESASPTDAAPPDLETWDQCLAGAPDVRVICEKATSVAESFEWHDDDGDGRRDMEKRVAFGPEGEEHQVEQIDLNDAGMPHQRSLSIELPAQKRHVVDQLFVDGGWTTTSEYDTPYNCEYQPIVPMRLPGK